MASDATAPDCSDVFVRIEQERSHERAGDINSTVADVVLGLTKQRPATRFPIAIPSVRRPGDSIGGRHNPGARGEMLITEAPRGEDRLFVGAISNVSRRSPHQRVRYDSLEVHLGSGGVLCHPVSQVISRSDALTSLANDSTSITSAYCFPNTAAYAVSITGSRVAVPWWSPWSPQSSTGRLPRLRPVTPLMEALESQALR